jgi:hypothetical protein
MVEGAAAGVGEECEKCEGGEAGGGGGVEVGGGGGEDGAGGKVGGWVSVKGAGAAVQEPDCLAAAMEQVSEQGGVHKDGDLGEQVVERVMWQLLGRCVSRSPYMYG